MATAILCCSKLLFLLACFWPFSKAWYVFSSISICRRLSNDINSMDSIATNRATNALNVPWIKNASLYEKTFATALVQMNYQLRNKAECIAKAYTHAACGITQQLRLRPFRVHNGIWTGDLLKKVHKWKVLGVDKEYYLHTSVDSTDSKRIHLF